MMVVMLIAGIICLLAGLVAIGFGIPISEFGFGNTLILAGAIASCAGLIILSMWAAVRELKGIADRMGSNLALNDHAVQSIAALPRPALAEPPGSKPDDRMHGEPEEVAEASAQSSAPSSVPWQEQGATRDRPRGGDTVPQEPPATAKSRRNLMFSSTSRRERERAQLRAAETSAGEPQAARSAAPTTEGDDASPATFEDAWPRSERSRPADAIVQRRAARAASTANEAPVRQPPPASPEEQPAVTILKSGVVDGMAYSLYSDGSIEAQMPEGMMRFASIDELRAHLDQRP